MHSQTHIDSSIWYHIVGALALYSSVKHTLVKYVIFFNLNSTMIHLSTLALLPNIDISFILE